MDAYYLTAGFHNSFLVCTVQIHYVTMPYQCCFYVHANSVYPAFIKLIQTKSGRQIGGSY